MRSDTVGFAVEAVTPEQLSFPRVPVRAGFIYSGILAGSVLGIYEAVLLYSSPLYSIREPVVVGPLIFLAAPMVDLLVFGLLGYVLGYVAEKISPAGGRYLQGLCAAGFGLAGGFACGVSYLRFGWDQHPKQSILEVVVVAGAVGVSMLSLAALRKWEHRLAGFASSGYTQCIRRLRIGAVAIGVVLVAWVAIDEVREFESISAPPAFLADAATRPNIVLITIDAAAADHLSCYGYSRQTTPTIDRLATQGVKFENAIAPSSWTLPSFASMFTGLFPHQHGADFTSPLRGRFPTLAMALKSAGYQTVGFNANLWYGQARMGMSQGFDLYEDGSENLRQNFMQTLFGRAFEKFVYMRFAHSNPLERQGAEEINRKVFHWFRHRRPQPYFLFINYFDVHSPYFAPRPYSKRFGQLPYVVVNRLDSEVERTARPDLTSAEQAALVAGYDNTLAYADSQIGVLMQFLAKSPDWSNTMIVITADHGETFGEHGSYLHGTNLWRELVRVPLNILGPGVPAGIRVPGVVGTQRLYATILGFAEKGPSPPSSLQNYWSGNQDPAATSPPVISELNLPVTIPRLRNVYISLITTQWHWILDSQGHMQLFDWVKDPQEKADLAGSPEAIEVVKDLQQSLRERVMTTRRPWEGLGYLQPLGLRISSPPELWNRDELENLPYQ